MESENNSSTPLVALTGGIGSGKSTALAAFAALGAAVLDCDQVVHDLLGRDDVRRLVADALGTGRLPAGDDGRRLLATAVFTDSGKLQQLEEVLHPLVRREIESWSSSREIAAAPLAVVEVPLLFESGMEDMFNARVLVTAPVATRRRRVESRLAIEDFERRSERQLPERDKQNRCDFSFANDGSPAALEDFVRQVYNAIVPASTP